MAKKLQAGRKRKTITLASCPFCGCSMMAERRLASDDHFTVGCSNEDCVLSLIFGANFFVEDCNIQKFMDHFNARHPEELSLAPHKVRITVWREKDPFR